MAVVKLGVVRSRGYISYRIVLPKKLVELLGWSPKDMLIVELKEVNGRKGLFIYKG